MLAILATGALLAVGVAVATMIRSEADSKADDQALIAEPTPTATPKPKPKKHQKKKPALTKAQRAARSAAVAELRRQGYKPVRLADWHARQTLRVLIGGQGAQRAGLLLRRPALHRQRRDDAEREAAGRKAGRALGHARVLGLALRRPRVLPARRLGAGALPLAGRAAAAANCDPGRRRPAACRRLDRYPARRARGACFVSAPLAALVSPSDRSR